MIKNVLSVNARLIIVQDRVKFLKEVENYTQKVLIKMFRPSKKYPSRETVP